MIEFSYSRENMEIKASVAAGAWNCHCLEKVSSMRKIGGEVL